MPSSAENIVGFAVSEEHCHFILMDDELGAPGDVFIWVPVDDVRLDLHLSILLLAAF